MNLILSKLSRRASFLFFLILLIHMCAAFTVFDDGGYLAVREEATKKVFRTEVRIDTLPKSDAALLTEGIACENTVELARVMENFNS